MKFAILETISTSGGHEVDFDRMLIEELRVLGHEVEMYVPRGYNIKYENVKYNWLDADIVSYVGLGRVRKLWAGVRREKNRQFCYTEMYERAVRGEFDAIIVPIAGYRFLRALRCNKLKKSLVPVIFDFNGITPKELPKFCGQVEKLVDCDNIRTVVITCAKDILGYNFNNKNIYLVPPAVLMPRDIGVSHNHKENDIKGNQLILGSFGQFRREKKLDKFLELFLSGKYTRPVKLMIQGATVSPADSEEFERIIAKFSHYEQLSFLHKGLWGIEWQQAVNNVDALLLPYGSERYRYSWSAMLFTAIGYQKPIIASDLVIPNGFGECDLGVLFEDGNDIEMLESIETFVNTYDLKKERYQEELKKAAENYSGLKYAQAIVAACSLRRH